MMPDATTAVTRSRIADYTCYFRTLHEAKAHMLTQCEERIRKYGEEAAQLQAYAGRVAKRMPGIRLLTEADIQTETLIPIAITKEML